MTFDEYQKRAAEFAVYPKDREREYLALGLISEVGELAGKVKKEIRDGVHLTEAILGELGDCAWYAAMNCTSCGFEMQSFLNGFKPHEYDGMTAVEIIPIFAHGASGFASSMRADMMRTVGMSSVITGLALLALRYSTTLEAVCEANIAKLTDRKERGKLQGSGDNR